MQPTKTRTLRFPALANYINPTITDDVAYGRERTRTIETARRFAVSVSSGAISGTIAIAQAITLALEDAAIPFPVDFDLESKTPPLLFQQALKSFRTRPRGEAAAEKDAVPAFLRAVASFGGSDAFGNSSVWRADGDTTACRAIADKLWAHTRRDTGDAKVHGHFASLVATYHFYLKVMCRDQWRRASGDNAPAAAAYWAMIFGRRGFLKDAAIYYARLTTGETHTTSAAAQARAVAVAPPVMGAAAVVVAPAPRRQAARRHALLPQESLDSLRLPAARGAGGAAAGALWSVDAEMRAMATRLGCVLHGGADLLGTLTTDAQRFDFFEALADDAPTATVLEQKKVTALKKAIADSSSAAGNSLYTTSLVLRHARNIDIRATFMYRLEVLKIKSAVRFRAADGVFAPETTWAGGGGIVPAAPEPNWELEQEDDAARADDDDDDAWAGADEGVEELDEDADAAGGANNMGLPPDISRGRYSWHLSNSSITPIVSGGVGFVDINRASVDDIFHERDHNGQKRDLGREYFSLHDILDLPRILPANRVLTASASIDQRAISVRTNKICARTCVACDGLISRRPELTMRCAGCESPCCPTSEREMHSSCCGFIVPPTGAERAAYFCTPACNRAAAVTASPGPRNAIVVGTLLPLSATARIVTGIPTATAPPRADQTYVDAVKAFPRQAKLSAADLDAKERRELREYRTNAPLAAASRRDGVDTGLKTVATLVGNGIDLPSGKPAQFMRNLGNVDRRGQECQAAVLAKRRYLFSQKPALWGTLAALGTLSVRDTSSVGIAAFANVYLPRAVPILKAFADPEFSRVRSGAHNARMSTLARFFGGALAGSLTHGNSHERTCTIISGGVFTGWGVCTTAVMPAARAAAGCVRHKGASSGTVKFPEPRTTSWPFCCGQAVQHVYAYGADGLIHRLHAPKRCCNPLCWNGGNFVPRDGGAAVTLMAMGDARAWGEAYPFYVDMSHGFNFNKPGPRVGFLLPP